MVAAAKAKFKCFQMHSTSVQRFGRRGGGGGVGVGKQTDVEAVFSGLNLHQLNR